VGVPLVQGSGEGVWENNMGDGNSQNHRARGGDKKTLLGGGGTWRRTQMGTYRGGGVL